MSPAASDTQDLKAAWSAFASGCTNLLFSEAPQAWRGADKARFRIEQEKILRHIQPVGMGLFATVFCFVTFRVSGSRWWIQLRDTYFRSSSSIVAAAESTSKNQATQTPFKSHLTRESEKKEKKIQDLMQLPLDLTLSVILGSSVFLLLFESEKLQEDLIEIPLLPGKSLVHSCVCPPVVRAIHEHQLSLRINSLDATNNSAEDETRRFFAKFAENCQTRTRYLARRKNQNMPHWDSVPYPGLKSRGDS